MNIIEDAIVNNVKEDQRFLKPKETTLKRAANRFRAKMRPTDPVDLDFEVFLSYNFRLDFMRFRPPERQRSSQ